MITIIVSKTRWWWPYIGWLLVGALNTDITADRPHPSPTSGDIIIDIIITMGIIVIVIMIKLKKIYSASAPSRESIKIHKINDLLGIAISYRILKCHGQFQIFIKLSSSRKHLYFFLICDQDWKMQLFVAPLLYMR